MQETDREFVVYNEGPYGTGSIEQGRKEIACWPSSATDDRRPCIATLSIGHIYCGYTMTRLARDISYDELDMLLREAIDDNRIDNTRRFSHELTYGIDEQGRVGFDLGHAFDNCIDTDGVPFREKTHPFSLIGESWGDPHSVEDLFRYTDALANTLAEFERIVEPDMLAEPIDDPMPSVESCRFDSQQSSL